MPKYNEVILQHNLESVPMIQKVVSEFNPELIMEIGTAHGGLVLVFRDACPNAEIHTYDIINKITNPIKFKNINIHIKDVFKSNLADLCKDERRKFLFCDGFDKKKEMLTFGPLLNKGDMLGCHDYPTRLWKGWKRKDKSKLKPIIDHEIVEFLKDYDEHEANRLFEEKQVNIHKNDFSDRYWIKRE